MSLRLRQHIVKAHNLENIKRQASAPQSGTKPGLLERIAVTMKSVLVVLLALALFFQEATAFGVYTPVFARQTAPAVS
jgi:hypothetical protein